jgi:hypothetical protein
MKASVGIYVRQPKDAIKVVEALVENNCSVVIHAHLYNPNGQTIFMVGYGEVEDSHDDVRHHFEDMLSGIYGDVADVSKGNQAILPPVGLQFAIDVLDDSGVMHRISCAKYSPERAYKMAIEAAGLLSNVKPGSPGNVLARSMLLAALGSSVGDELKERLKKAA